MKLLFAAILITHLVNAQHNWTDGVVVLTDNRVITGAISVAQDVLLMKEGNERVNVFPAYKISSFRFHDSTANINRHYLSLSHKERIFQTRYFYEIVVWGNTSVIRKEHQTVYKQTANADAEHFDYFVLLDQEIIPLKKFKVKAYPRLQSIHPSLAETVMQQKLNPNCLADAIRIVQLSNKKPYEISIAGL